MGVLSRAFNAAWNAFRADEQTPNRTTYDYTPGMSSSTRPYTGQARYSNEKSIISSIYTRIGIDVAGVEFRHVRLDDKGRFKENVDSRLQDCFDLEANLDQAPQAFRMDIVQTLFDKGVAAIVPVDTDKVPVVGGDFDIFTMRVGDITEWKPRHVRVNLYNEAKGLRQEVLLEKRFVAIVENPMFAVMNEQNSTLQRLIRKLNLLDSVDEATSSGKLDLIIQLPYVVKSDARRQQAESRRAEIEWQLKGSQYGIAYTDGTEKITQLNRPTENNLLKQIEYLTGLLYNQLGLTPEVMAGTANEEAMINYRQRTIKPIVIAIKEAMQRAWLGQMGTNKKERIHFYINPFELMTMKDFAEVADKLSRNEVLSPNELRGYIGLPPSDDPKADQLRNSNMPHPEPLPPPAPPGPSMSDMDKILKDVLGELEADIDKQLEEA